MKFTVEMVARRVEFERLTQVYFSEAFNQAVTPAANLRIRELLEEKILDDGKEYRKVRYAPRVDLPGPIRKFAGGDEIEQLIDYCEITVFNRAARTATLEIESVAGETIQVFGNVRFIEEGDGVRMKFDGEAKVKIFGIGKVIERFIVSEVKKRYALVERFLQTYLDEGRDRTAPPA
jgi:hypothetical protein